jgi:hypothetical protein
MGHAPETIAQAAKVPVRDVEIALSAMRGPRPDGTNHATLNVTKATANMVKEYAAMMGQPIWKTMEDIVALSGLGDPRKKT